MARITIWPRGILRWMARWLGVDVGRRRKGFDIALVDDRRVVALAGRLDRRAVIECVETYQPTVVAIDSPRCWTPAGQATRDGERRLAKSICGIRWTPDERRGRASQYYAWIVEGLDLFDALARHDAEVIEVFPTASWTRWHGKRGARSRAAWSRARLGDARPGRRASAYQPGSARRHCGRSNGPPVRSGHDGGDGGDRRPRWPPLIARRSSAAEAKMDFVDILVSTRKQSHAIKTSRSASRPKQEREGRPPTRSHPRQSRSVPPPTAGP